MKKFTAEVPDSVYEALQDAAKQFKLSFDEFVNLVLVQDVIRMVEEVGLKLPNQKQLEKDLKKAKEYFNDVISPRIEKAIMEEGDPDKLLFRED